jgi:hypothetical protein
MDYAISIAYKFHLVSNVPIRVGKAEVVLLGGLSSPLLL